MIPMKIKTKISLSVEEKKSEIKDIINKPHDVFYIKKSWQVERNSSC